MSNRSKAAGRGVAGRRCRGGRIATALTAVLFSFTLVAVSGEARAEVIVLKSGEVVEGAIIEATRNTVIVQRTIGGMRQMPIQDIGEVRFDLAQGLRFAGEFLGWADGVYKVRSGDQIIRISKSGILSREPSQQTARPLPTRPPVQQQSTAAAAPSTTERTAVPASERQSRSRAAAGQGSNAAAADAQRAAADNAERQSESAAAAKNLAPADPQKPAAAGKQVAAVGDQGTLAVKASVDPPEPGARSMVFNIELSQPAKQTVVLIYATVDGTAKAGKDYEAQKGMVTVAPGVRSAEVRVPLIEGAPEDGEKRFELFLMTDPKVAEVVDRRVVATIKGLMPAAAQENAATKAVEAAKQYAGTTINTEEEAGLMAMLGINITGPEWEELTGIKVRVSEVPYEELFPKAMLEHRAGTGAYDMLTIAPSWLADMVRAGALEPLDPYIERYGVKSEFDDIAPAFRDWMTFDGKTYALVVDGDVHILYYRKDLFEDPANMAEFKAKYGYDLAPPDDWQKFGEICQFLTDKYAPELYGAGLINTGYTYYFFFERFRSYGGRFFDPETMKATVNSEAGVKALTDMVEQNECQPPGVQNWGFGESLSALNSGEIAMTITWPPVARWAQGINADEQALSWVPPTQVKDKIGYAVTPSGHSEMAAGIMLALSPNSKNKDATYLYIQWLHSQQESLKNVMRPLGLRDPFRISHYDSPEFQALWPTAKDYLATHKQAVETGYADLAILETYKYWDSAGRAVNAAIGGKDPKQALDDLAAEWDQLTEQIGVDRQREAYTAWAATPAAYRVQ